MELYACLYIICIEILFHYVMLVRACTFDIYVRCDIMLVFFFSVACVTYNVLCPTMSSLGVRYEPTLWAHVHGRRPCMKKYHASNPSRNYKSPRLCYVYKR